MYRRRVYRGLALAVITLSCAMSARSPVSRGMSADCQSILYTTKDAHGGQDEQVGLGLIVGRNLHVVVKSVLAESQNARLFDNDLQELGFELLTSSSTLSLLRTTPSSSKSCRSKGAHLGKGDTVTVYELTIVRKRPSWTVLKSWGSYDVTMVMSDGSFLINTRTFPQHIGAPALSVSGELLGVLVGLEEIGGDTRTVVESVDRVRELCVQAEVDCYVD